MNNAIGNEPQLPRALPLLRVGDLITVRGFDAQVIEALEPFVTFLPSQTTINVNTAPAEVLAAAVPLSLPIARQLVSKRERTFYRTLDDFKQAIGNLPEDFVESQFSVASNFFLVRGLIRFGRVQSFSETLLQREPQRRRVKVIWQRRL